MATVVEILARLKADTSQFQSAMGQAASGLKSAGDKMTSVGQKLSLSVTAPLVGIGTAAVVMANDFESSLAKIEGLVGIAADEIDGMRDSVLTLATETAKAPQELADALFVITSAGLRGEEALSALEYSARAGAAGLGETNDIARALAGAMNAYGSDVLDAARATDVIVATARAGNFETSQFAAAIGRVLPFAKQAGASFEDMGGAVALLTRTNGDAAQSVTQMAALFRAFVVPTEEAKKAFEGVGLSAAEMRQMIADDGLPAALSSLDDALGGNREQLGRLLGSSEAASAAFQILDADAATLQATFGEVGNASGITGEAFDAVAKTGAFQLEQAMTTLKTSLIEVGDIIAPVIADLANKFQDLVTAFRGLPDEAKQMVVIAGAVAAAIGPLLIVAGQLIGAIGAIAGALSFLAAHPVVLAIIAIVAAIAALVVGIKYAYDNFEGFRAFVQQTWANIQTAVAAVVGFFQGTVWPVMQRVFQDIQAVALLLWENGIKPAWEGIQEAVNSVVGNFMEYVWPNIQKVFDFIGEAVTALYEEFIKPNWEKIQTAIAPVVDWLQSNVMPILGAVFSAIGQGVAFLANAMATYWGMIFRIIGPVIGWLVDYVGPIVMGVWRVIWTGLSMLVDFTIFYWQAIMTVVGAAADFFMSYVWPTIQAVFSNVIAGAQIVWAGISAAFSAITGFISSAVSTIASVLGSIAGVVTTVIGFFARLREGILEAVGNAISTVSEIPGRILGALGSLGSLLYNAGRSVIQGLINGLKSMWDSVQGFFSDLTGAITGWKGPESVDRRLLVRSGQLIMDGFINGLESRRGDVRSSLESLTREVGAFSPDLGTGRMMRISAATPTISPTTAATAGGSGGIHIENLNVTSAPGERAETSVPRQLRRMAWVAGLDG